jgi:hypothetical protein
VTIRLRALVATLAVVLSAAAPRAASSQARTMTGSISSSVNVLFPPLTGAGVRPLNFGMIIPGTTAVTVLPRTNAGAEFRITGTKSRKSLDIVFVLPAALVGPNAATIPLSFNGNYAGLCEVDDATGLCIAASATTWNPTSLLGFHDTPTRFQNGRKAYTYDTYAVYLGGVASPVVNQRPGHYTGTASVQIVIN